jgi:hypothetical protein
MLASCGFSSSSISLMAAETAEEAQDVRQADSASVEVRDEARKKN